MLLYIHVLIYYLHLFIDLFTISVFNEIVKRYIIEQYTEKLHCIQSLEKNTLSSTSKQSTYQNIQEA